MAYSSCATCRGRLTGTSGQDRPIAVAAHNVRGIPDSVIAACLVLVMVIAAILVQVIPLQLIPDTRAANTSASPSPVLTPEGTVTAETGISATVVVTLSRGPDTISRSTTREVPVITATSLESRIHARVNRVRQEHGLSALGTEAALTSLARAHSADMAARGYFGHVNLDERDATARGAAAGYTCHKIADPSLTYAIAENLYATYRYSSVLLRDYRGTGYAWTTEEAMADETVEAWMNSPDHRDNILDPGMGREGIGVAFGQGDMVFVTQDFC